MLPTPSHPLLDHLWAGYIDDVPYARAFVELVGGTFENDHIALRSLAREGEGSGMKPLIRVFESRGWSVQEHYLFPDVHLRAVYLSQPGLPRVFVSELDANALPAAARDHLLAVPLDPEPPRISDERIARWFCAPSTRPNRAAVDVVAAASQYGAWLMCFGRRVNHFTAVVDDVAAWQQRLQDHGVPMKAEIEGDPIPPGGIGLRQTATAAAELEVTFDDGSVGKRPYAYFEIAERKGGFDGFLAQQARQLFDQTK
ncbi:MAG: DUF1338 family protein [Deltaproteobacteria bacterium]|nr:DUF1338 family protein [Deltaproteobacteria bacterium]